MRYLMGRYGSAATARRAARRRASVRYRSQSDPLTALRQRMRELAQTRVRFGYRRLRVLMLREGWEVGKEALLSRLHRGRIGLAAEAAVAARDGGASQQRRPATARNDIWSMDFVADRDGRWSTVSCLTVIDLFTRECLAIDAGQGLGGHDVAATLERLRFERGLPQRIYCDNGLP